MQREMHNMVSRHLQAHNVIKGVRINTKPASGIICDEPLFLTLESVVYNITFAVKHDRGILLCFIFLLKGCSAVESRDIRPTTTFETVT